MSTRTRFRLLSVAAILWCLALTWLVYSSSNPVVLNPLQLRMSHFVVVIDHPTPDGKLRVREVWSKRGDSPQEIQLETPITLPQTDQLWIVPVQAIGQGKFRITSGFLPQENPAVDEKYRIAKVSPFVYPATATTRASLQQILGRTEPIAVFNF